MENVEQLLLFAINHPFVTKTFDRQGRKFVLRMLAQKYLYRDNFFNLTSRRLQSPCLHVHN